MKNTKIVKTWPFLLVFILSIIYSPSFTQTENIKGEPSIDGGIGSSGIGGTEAEWPYDFDIGANYNVNGFPETYYFYDAPYNYDAFHCPGTTNQTVTESHKGQYKERRWIEDWKFYKDGWLIYEYYFTSEDQMTSSQTWNNFQLNANVDITEDGYYWWHLRISQHKLIWGWELLCNQETAHKYIDVYEEYENINTVLSSNEYYDIFAREEIVFYPGFEYNPNSPKELEAEIKDCLGYKVSSNGDDFVENSIKAADLKSAEITGTDEVIEKGVKKDGIRIYPNPSNDGNFMVLSNNQDIIKIRVLDSSGAIVYSNNGIKSMREYLNLTSYGKGIYFVQIIFADKVVTKKNNYFKIRPDIVKFDY